LGLKVLLKARKPGLIREEGFRPEGFGLGGVNSFIGFRTDSGKN